MSPAKRLRRLDPLEVPANRRDPVDPDTLAAAAKIVAEVRAHGLEALRGYAERFDGVPRGAPLVWDRSELERALGAIPAEDRALLERTAQRIRLFAEAQRGCLANLTIPIPGGRAGHTVSPVEKAACYAPGGRFPLPSSVLMTAVTARVAGVETVWVASPRPYPITLAAAAVAGADALLAAGGAQAIAALTFGCGDIPSFDVVVGPGNRWVTAAKQIVAGHVGIDMLAGPSELVIFADDTADPDVVAADLLAQAEHDPDALPVLVTTSSKLADTVDTALERQLADLSTAETASSALENGFVVIVPDLDTGIEMCDRLAPEHLALFLRNAATIAPRMSHYGALFIGFHAAEVLGDYGAGPNHTLPTGGTARSAAGLSVLDFLRVRTWMEIDDASAAKILVTDAAALGRHEGLEGHVRSAELRL